MSEVQGDWLSGFGGVGSGFQIWGCWLCWSFQFIKLRCFGLAFALGVQGQNSKRQTLNP